jgi:hypothetical protein
MNIVRMSGGLVAFALVLASGCAPTHTSASRGMFAVGYQPAPGFGTDGPTPSEQFGAAKALRDAEVSACIEVPDADRDGGPFAHRDLIQYVEEVRDRLYPKQMAQTFGIAVYVRATPGITEQWLGRVIKCHQAHLAVAGSSDNAADPLVRADVRIKIDSTPEGFRVAITSPDLDVARDLVARGNALFPSGS